MTARTKKQKPEALARDILAPHQPCGDAVVWLAGRTPEAAWRDCPRGDWLLWAAARLWVDRRLIVRAAAECARAVLYLVPAGEDRPRLAIEAALAWAEEPSAEGANAARAAATAADAAAHAAYAAWAAHAANAARAAEAAWAAHAANAAANAADAAANAAANAASAAAAAYAATATAAAYAAYAASATAAAYAAYAASAAYAAANAAAVCANIVRATIPWDVVCARDVLDGRLI